MIFFFTVKRNEVRLMDKKHQFSLISMTYIRHKSFSGWVAFNIYTLSKSVRKILSDAKKQVTRFFNPNPSYRLTIWKHTITSVLLKFVWFNVESLRQKDEWRFLSQFYTHKNTTKIIIASICVCVFVWSFFLIVWHEILECLSTISYIAVDLWMNTLNEKVNKKHEWWWKNDKFLCFPPLVW